MIVHGIKFNVSQSQFFSIYRKIKNNPELKGKKYKDKLKYIKSHWSKYYKPKKIKKVECISPARKNTIRSIEDIRKLSQKDQYAIYKELYKDFEGIDPKELERTRIKNLLDSI